jgi:integrase
MVRGYAAYCQGLGIGAALAPAHCLPSARSRATPHIYTQVEVEALLDACPRVFHRYRFVAETMATMILLLCATGMRLSEALKVEIGDIDTNAGTLLVKASKGGPHHLIPVHPTTADALMAFADSPERARLGLGAGDLLFVSMRGKPHQPVGIQSNFARLRAGCTIQWQGQPPRLHDFRHTFATRQMIRAYTTDGPDPANTLALVSNWLGHSDPAHTYWYIQNVPELLALAAARRDITNPTEDPR